MREYLRLTQADEQAYEARLRAASPMMFDLARKLQRAAFRDSPTAPCHVSNEFTPAPLYLAQAWAITYGAVDLSDEVGAGSIVRMVREILDKFAAPPTLVDTSELGMTGLMVSPEAIAVTLIPPPEFTIPTNWSIYHDHTRGLWIVQIDYGPTTRRYSASTITLAVAAARRGEA